MMGQNDLNNADVSLAKTLGEKIPKAHRFSHEAMATIFEIFIDHENEKYSRQAANEAFKLVDRLEQKLSRFIPNSDIARIGKLKTGQKILVSIEAFECMQIAKKVFELTNGAFDITVGSVGDITDESKKNSDTQVFSFNDIEMDEEAFTVAVNKEGVCADPGAIGKGFALDKCCKLLEDWGIKRALIHSGSSTILTMDAPVGFKGWPVTVSKPPDYTSMIHLFDMSNCTLSGSGRYVKNHIIDPRTQKPAQKAIAAWAYLQKREEEFTGAMADGLSTAFMVMEAGDVEKLCKEIKAKAILVVPQKKDKTPEILKIGF